MRSPARPLLVLASVLAVSMAPAMQAFEGTRPAMRARTDVHARASAGQPAGVHPVASKKKQAAPAARHAAPADGPPPPPLDNPALRRDQPVRIGLSANRERVVLSCAGPFRVTDPATGQAAWKESYGQPLMVGVRGAPPTEGRIYRAQTGSFEKKEAAEELAARLRTGLGEPVVVAWVPDRKVWRVRVGAADSREGLAGVMAKLRAAGHADAWINDEPVPQEGESHLVLVDANYDTKVAPSKALLVEPAVSGSLLSVDGKTYRGSLEVRIDLSGAIRVVNVLPVESYLRGVVPAELGPGVYPELEALKAQAVAARTYVYRNLGQFAGEGFDLCDTPRCQVYEGVKVEHPLSDRAIRETEGEIETWLGTPINALYTSTCGGHTEDAIEIFPEDAAPYLTGVPCAPEQRSHRARRILLAGDPALADAAAPAAEAAALLAVHGLIPRGALGAGSLAQTIPTAEAEAWIESMRSACGTVEEAAGAESDGAGRPGETGTGRSGGKAVAHGREPVTNGHADAGGGAIGGNDADARDARSTANGGAIGNGAAAGAGGAGGHGTMAGNGSQGDTVGAPGNGFPGGDGGAGPTIASLAAALVERLGWQARVALLVGNEDPESWLPDDEPALSPAEAVAVAYFLREGAWPESGRGLPEPRRVAARGDLARLLLHAARSCDLLDLDEAIVRGGDEAALTLSRKGAKESRRIDPSALLFADFGAGPAPVRRVAVVAGDKVRYHAGAAGALDELLLLPGRQGSSDDRYSSVSTWQVAYTAEELTRRLDQYLGSGSLLDVVAVRRGVSGRVTELKVVGTGGQATIKGFRIRTALGLKENLFTIVRQRTRAGALRRVVFTGRGWGHGVGLCQIGSYGMALRGASYREILAHYYSGAILARVP